jgi:hypothetical protein
MKLHDARDMRSGQHSRCGRFVSLVWLMTTELFQDKMSGVLIGWRMADCHGYAWINQEIISGVTNVCDANSNKNNFSEISNALGI